MLSDATIHRIAGYRLLGARVITVCTIAFFGLHTLFAPHVAASPTLPLIGFCLVVLGNFIRSWSAGIIHKKKSLTDVGPYSVVRHPLYVGSFFISLGFGFLLHNIVLWILLLLPYVLIYPFTIMSEERHMARIHGQAWLDYKRRVYRFWPRAWGSINLSARWEASQWLKHHEYNALGASLVVAVLLWLGQRWV